MEIAHWFVLVGSLMLARGLWGSTIARLPFTSASIYLLIGIVLGPAVLGVFSFDPVREAPLLETLTEVAILVSLFSAGVKLPVPFNLRRWAVSLRLAVVAMSLSVALCAVFAAAVLGLPAGAAILLGAMLAPTDPVLATDVQLRHAGDKDSLRFALTCEAGMNDGTAFPFVVLGLLLGLEGPDLAHWFWEDALLATLVGVGTGLVCGAAMAGCSYVIRRHHPGHQLLDDLLGLGLIALAYGIALLLGGWGFLAVFFAGVALRQTEWRLTEAPPDGHGLVHGDAGASGQATVSHGSLVFKEHLERLSELGLVLLLGGAMTADLFSPRAWLVAVFLIFVARPLSVVLSLAGSGTGTREAAIAAWFGVRGIGSIYYLMYAINHGVPAALARELVTITLATIILSIVVHGASVKALLDRYWD
ncbi:sodium:proton antiporter [Massilia sp. ZL223]|uniref:cation:proton antiporter n=1 Tax=Massilia sp. ZL223 TaxID=2824904 RepID=UPI001B838463|nr:cation:proton antiporter [Massilia sp. ZL223]MBQ5965656.1 cation:proton antiporter [Massilia sp. ZL223]